MTDNSRFTLEKALAAWRRTLEHQRMLAPADVDELTAHVRDQVEALVEEGWSEVAAFEEAMREVGDFASTTLEYEKVYWAKQRHQGTFRNAIHAELSMYKNYLRIALRNLCKYKLQSLLNVFGLAIGLACFLVIFLYVRDELSYDRYHTHADDLYRLVYDEQSGDEFVDWAYSRSYWAEAVQESFPEVVQTARISWNTNSPEILVEQDDRRFYETRFYHADSTIFALFDMPFIAGDPATALNQPYALVLTESMARKYFGRLDVLGQTLRVNGSNTYTVTGVVEDQPLNTHLPFDFFGSFATHYAQNPEYQSQWVYTYMRLRPGETGEALQAKFPAFIDTYFEAPIYENFTWHLQAVPDIHLYSHRDGEISANNRAIYIYVLALIAAFVLFIACFNFVNLSIALWIKRAKEVGTRKVVGAERSQLVTQFLGEAMLLAMLAVGTAVLFVEITLPFFNSFADKELALGYFTNPITIPSLLMLAVIVGGLSGLYPALRLSAFRPLDVLRGSLKLTSHRSPLRRVLVTGQFVFSILLIIGALVVQEQLAFMQGKNLGFSKEQVLVIPLSNPSFDENYLAFKETLLQNTDVRSVTTSTNKLGERIWTWNFRPEGWPDGEEDWLSYALLVDPDFLKTYQMELVAGRDFSRDRPADLQDAFIVNEAAAALLDWDDAVGKQITIPGNKQGQVIGVVKDFNYASLHDAVEPMILHLTTSFMRFVSIRVSTDDMPSTLAFLDETWSRFEPGRPLTYSFVDSEFEALYRTEERLSHLFTWFTSLAILIACLGLFGLASYIAEQRTKEIGVRKALGASSWSIIGLLTKDFAALIGIAFALAAPIAYIGMQWWLDAFAYRIDIGLLTFVVAGGSVLFVALTTVSYQAIRAAWLDPVKALRYE